MGWAKVQRDEAIGQASEKVVTSTPPSDNLTLSFATEASADDRVASRDTVTPAIRNSNAPSLFYEPDTSADELLSNCPPQSSGPRFHQNFRESNLPGPLTANQIFHWRIDNGTRMTGVGSREWPRPRPQQVGAKSYVEYAICNWDFAFNDNLSPAERIRSTTGPRFGWVRV